MSPAQRARFFGDWWPRIAARRGVPANDREARHAFYAEAGLGGEINTTDGFDKLKAHCLALLDDANVTAQVRVLQQPTRRLHWKIVEVLKCLALYPLSKPMGWEGARQYATEIIRDKVNSGSLRNVSELEDLSDAPRSYLDSEDRLIELPSQVGQMVMTLSARLNGRDGFRNRAAHTLHEMKTLAGVKCYCKPCRLRAGLPQPRRSGAATRRPVPVDHTPHDEAVPF